MQSFRVALRAHDVCKNKITEKTEHEITYGRTSDIFRPFLANVQPTITLFRHNV